jgi:threonine/homoserine/homoserine lactone efflux protein
MLAWGDGDGVALILDTSQLAGFVVAAAVLVIVPGPNTVLILAQSLAGGRGAGLATVLGVETGTIVHTLAAALGLSAVLLTSSAAFEALRYSGAAYLMFLGLRALIAGERAPIASAPAAALTPPRAYARAVATNVLNPNVAVFFLALLPQFVHAERRHVASQFAVLGAILGAMGLVVGSLLALTAVRVSHWLRSDAVLRWQAGPRAPCWWLSACDWRWSPVGEAGAASPTFLHSYNASTRAAHGPKRLSVARARA